MIQDGRNGEGASLRDHATHEQSRSVSALRVGIVSADGWADKRLKAAYIELESVQAAMPKLSTERGCLSSALAAIELADEYVAKSQREAL